MTPSEEMLQQIIEFLWQRHVQAEQQYLYWVLIAPVVALLFFLVMWKKYKAHEPGLLGAMSFFIAPRGPERMLIFKDLSGNRMLLYDYKVVKGTNGYIVQAGPYMLKMQEDPESYAEPVSLIDARGPPGLPSPFGLLVRQIVASYIMLMIIAVSFANTFWVTATVYARAMNVGFTRVDLASFAALVVGTAWFLSIFLRSLSPQTLLVSLSAIGMSEGYVEATPALDVYSSYPPSRLLRSIAREPKIVISDSAVKIIEKLEQELGDRSLAASLLALLGQVYETWRRSLGILLQDRYDISVAGRARYQLSEEKLPKSFLGKHAGLIALLAILIGLVAIILLLQPSIQPAATVTEPTSIATSTVTVTPAAPPPPPSEAPATVTPAQPPAPANVTTVG